uniref:Uncharacterized protein n=1 Tax=Panagrolaimus superbus TaxID=310955 RepID=A0A914Y9Z1_9BILA
MTPLKETDLHDSETSHLMITHGITHLLKFHEKKWTKKTLIKSTAITGAGIAQLVGGLGVGFGGALSGVGAVPGAIAAKVLLFEGISDILFGVKGFATGFSDNSYVKHKLIGLGMNAVMWMAPALLNIKKAEEKNIQSQNASEFAIKEIYKEIEKNVDRIFESSEIIKELQRMMQQILILYEDFVFIFDDIFEQFIAPNLYEICYFLVEKLRISIFENGEIEKGKNFEERISKILKSNEFFTFIKKFNEYLCKFVKQLQKSLSKKFMKFKAANNILEEQFVTETDSLDAEIKAKEMIENGMLDLKGKIMAALKEGIKVPLNYDIEEEYSKQLNFIIKNAYSELRNCAKINNEKESDGIETTDATVEATQKRSKVSIKAEEMDVEIFYDCL